MERINYSQTMNSSSYSGGIPNDMQISIDYDPKKEEWEMKLFSPNTDYFLTSHGRACGRVGGRFRRICIDLADILGTGLPGSQD